MSDIAIRVEGMGKRYRLGERAPYKTLRETIARGAAHDFRYALDRAKIRGELRWEPQVEFAEGLQRTVVWS